jgi:soluble lytic murein transglycosylase
LKHRILIFLIVIIVGLSLQSHGAWNDVVSAIQSGSDEKALKEIESSLAELSSSDNFDLKSKFIMAKILIQSRLGQKVDWTQIEPKELTVFQEMIPFYKAQDLYNEKKYSEAEVEFEKVRVLKSNFKFFSIASLKLADVLIEQKKWKAASALLIKLQKRMRGEEVYPEVLYKLLHVELELGKTNLACKWARVLYAKYPFNEIVKKWGPDLQLEEVAGRKLNCASDAEDFEKRIRNFQLAGKSDLALAEINLLKARNTKKTYELDSVYARYLMQEGDLKEALSLLLEYYNEYKDNTKYLMFLAQVSARAGEIPLAIGSFETVTKREPKSKNGIQAQFQSAFMCYQSRDYDGATRKFHTLEKMTPNNPLALDAKWHLAWLQYLKGDFKGASKSFQNMLAKKQSNPRKFKSFQLDRLTYWWGMSAYRQGKLNIAKQKFENLLKDGLLGYYAIAATQRLAAINKLMMTTSYRERELRKPAGFVMLSSDEGDPMQDVSHLDSSKMDEDQDFTERSEVGGMSGTKENVVEESEPVDVENDNADISVADKSEAETPQLASKELNERLLKAKLFKDLGFNEFAKFELFEIEKKINGQNSMKILMEEYKASHSYNRAAYIGQIKFSNERGHLGIDAARDLWEMTYPKAYQSDVESNSKESEIPQSLVWGIMRAESMYKTDIISTVGAIGLMQVMPFTGDKMAKLAGIKEFTSSQLFQPSISVKVGAKYLQRLAKKFDYSIPLIAAAYNAGPHRVEQWLYNFGYLDADEFIEHIPYVETRNYVKKVSDYYAIYNQLYKFEQPVSLSLNNPIPTFITQSPSLKESWEGP